jgi:hypothetical protein
MKALILSLLIVPLTVLASNLSEFETDYCTFFPEGTISKPRLWEGCCLEHDLVYWAGGTSKMQDLADVELGVCVTQKSSAFFGRLMYRGVRLGHYSPIKSKSRWGHGWGDKRSFQELSTEEKSVIRIKLVDSNINPLYIDNYLKKYID